MSEEQVKYSGEPCPDLNAISANKAKLFEVLKSGWNTFHKYVVYILIATALGVFVGVKVSQKFYADKMKDAILVGGMVFEGKPYTIIQK